MKTKALFLAALVSVAAVSANAGVRFGFSIGLPVPVVYAPPVVVAPAPVVYAAPVGYAPAPVVVAAPAVVAVPPCPGVDYVWAPGYWGYRGGVRVWVGGGWNYHPGHGYEGRGYDGHGHYDYGHRR